MYEHVYVCMCMYLYLHIAAHQATLLHIKAFDVLQRIGHDVGAIQNCPLLLIPGFVAIISWVSCNAIAAEAEFVPSETLRTFACTACACFAG